jgi:glutamine synthetase
MNPQETAHSNLRNYGYDAIEKEVSDNFTLVEYIWTDSTSTNIRGKTKVCAGQIKSIDDLDWWTYDGSSTGQAVTDDSEIWLKPMVLFKDPFRKPNGLIALCENFNSDRKTPALGNFRTVAAAIMKEAAHEDPWFGIEQEYFIKVRDGTLSSWPLGFPTNGFPQP